VKEKKEKMKTLISFFSLAISIPIAIWSHPASMDIGYFAIDKITGNGGVGFDLNWEVQGGSNFFTQAYSIIPNYCATHPLPSGSTSTPTLNVALANTAVTKAAITNSSSNSGNREYCDFVYYGGHGFPGGLYLGNAGKGYGNIFPADLKLGTGYTRFFVSKSCSFYKTATNPDNTPTQIVYWNQSFVGLKAMLGFKSLVFDNFLSANEYQDFWNYWTYSGYSLMDAFARAEGNYGYTQLGHSGLEAGCLSAVRPGVFNNYCEDNYAQVEHNWTKAATGTGEYLYNIIGSPEY